MQIIIDAIKEDATHVKGQVLELIADNSIDATIKNKLLNISIGLGVIEESAKRLICMAYEKRLY